MGSMRLAMAVSCPGALNARLRLHPSFADCRRSFNEMGGREIGILVTVATRHKANKNVDVCRRPAVLRG